MAYGGPPEGVYSRVAVSRGSTSTSITTANRTAHRTQAAANAWRLMCHACFAHGRAGGSTFRRSPGSLTVCGPPTTAMALAAALRLVVGSIIGGPVALSSRPHGWPGRRPPRDDRPRATPRRAWPGGSSRRSWRGARSRSSVVDLVGRRDALAHAGLIGGLAHGTSRRRRRRSGKTRGRPPAPLPALVGLPACSLLSVSGQPSPRRIAHPCGSGSGAVGGRFVHRSARGGCHPGEATNARRSGPWRRPVTDDFVRQLVGAV